MSAREDLGFACISGERPPAMVAGSGGGLFGIPLSVAIGVPLALVAIPVGIVGYLVYKANTEPEEPEDPEEMARAFEAVKAGGPQALAVEALAQAKTKKSLKTPFGVRVPNLARYVLPDAAQTRAAGSAYLQMKGSPR